MWDGLAVIAIVWLVTGAVLLLWRKIDEITIPARERVQPDQKDSPYVISPIDRRSE